jgi:hypothetical protein
MRLFTGISPASGETSLRAGYRALSGLIAKTRREEALWSLAELGTDDDDLLWLIDWARALQGVQVCQWLFPGPSRTAFGSLLLLLGAEFTRRSLPTDSRWPVPAPQVFSPAARGYLFNEDIPTIHHRLALLSAASRWGLHRVGGADLASLGHTVSLQIGFTESELYSHLRRWLAGEEELAPHLHTLLDQHTGTESFRSVWEACRAALAGRLATPDLVRNLATSPWILAQWHRPLQTVLQPRDGVVDDDILELPSFEEWPLEQAELDPLDPALPVLDEILHLLEKREEEELLVAAPVAVVSGSAALRPAGLGGSRGLKATDSGRFGPPDAPTGPAANLFYARRAESCATGDLHEVLIEEGTRGTLPQLRLRLARFIDPGTHHEVIVWDRSGRLSTVRPRHCEWAIDGAWWWSCELPENLAPVVVAISLDGRNLASWWSDDALLRELPQIVEANPSAAAWLLRWFQLPLLDEVILKLLQPLVNRFPLQFIRAWLKEDTGPGLLGMPFKDEEWFGIVREYLFNWWPEPSPAREVLMLLADVDNDHDLREYIFEAAQILNRLDPVVLGRILATWDIPNREMIRVELRRGFAGVVNLNLINARENALVARASQLFGVDAAFIHREILLPARQALAGETLSEAHLANLRLAARSEELRRLLAIHLLR